MLTFKNDTAYNFSVYDNLTGPTEYRSVVVRAIASYSVVRSLGFDPEAMWRQVLPNLPTNLSKNLRSYNYLVLENSGVREIVPVSWIIPNSVAISSKQNTIIKIYDIEHSDLDKIRKALNSIGIINFEFQ